MNNHLQHLQGEEFIEHRRHSLHVLTCKIEKGHNLLDHVNKVKAFAN